MIDYKSDSDKHYQEDAFVRRLRGKYTPQIEAYREAIGRLFDVSPERIKTALVSFSQKDLKAGEKLRVRFTPV